MASEAKAGDIEKKEVSEKKFKTRDIREDDAEKIVELFNIVYNGNYPLQEYLDPKWIKSQVGNPNLYFKAFEDDEGNFLGCGVIDYDPNRGILYGGRTVIYPEHQGKGILGGCGMETTRQIMQELNGKVKIFYGTSRLAPGDTGMQRTLEKIGFKPLALLCDLDTGIGDRESEIYQALIFSTAFKRRRKSPKILPEIEYILKAVKKQYRQVKDYEVVDYPEITNGSKKILVGIFEDVHEYYTYLTLSCDGNKIKVEINPKSESAEILSYQYENDVVFLNILNKLTKKLNVKGIKYVEGFVNAYEPSHQRTFLQAGFKATGYIPVLDTVGDQYEDRVHFSWIPGRFMTKSLEFTPLSWEFVNEFMHELGIKGIAEHVARGHVKFDLS